MNKLIVFSSISALLFAAVEPPKPGWNLFSPQQDIQLGREAQAQVEKQMTVVHSSQVTEYLREIGSKLQHTRYAGQFPFTFGLVADKNINAFSLPGGPVYVNTGLIEAADNEAQLAGVLAHEMSHVVLRHATNQASKANLIQLPAILAGGLAGGGLLGGLAQLGLGLGANSVLLKFSRSAESQADYNGALMMAEAGYNPIEMARFFEKLEAKDGHQGTLSQFLSDHPNPGNRVQAIENLIRQLPQRQYTTDTGQFQRIKDQVLHLPNRGQLHGDYRDQHSPVAPEIRPSSRLRDYQAAGYSIRYPENWEALGDQQGNAVTIAPRDALIQGSNGAVQIGYGAMISYYFPPGDQLVLERDTDALIRQLGQQNPGMRTRDRRPANVGGQRALEVTLEAKSPYQGETEVDHLATVTRPEGLFYVVFTAPSSEWKQVQGIFEEMLRSIRFR